MGNFVNLLDTPKDRQTKLSTIHPILHTHNINQLVCPNRLFSKLHIFTKYTRMHYLPSQSWNMDYNEVENSYPLIKNIVYLIIL